MSQIYVCKDCQDRRIGCHATCQKYIEQSRQRQERKEAIRKQKDLDAAQKDRAIEGAVRMKKRRHH